MPTNPEPEAERPDADTGDRRAGEGFEIVIDSDEIVAALRSRHEYPDRNGREVVTVRPPFTGEARGEHRFSETGNYWPPDMTPKPLDLRPDVFVGERGRDAEYPTWPAVRAQMRADDVEPTEENEREWYEEWRDVWESEVRAALKEEIDINEFGHGRRERVPVRYDNSDGD